jgi:cation-transporting ATPase 13A1
MASLTCDSLGQGKDLDKKFEPSLLNSSIFLLGLSQQVSTFVINFIGRPFREDIRENPPLYWGLLGASAVAYSGAVNLVPELSSWLQLVDMTAAFRYKLTVAMVVDFAGCYIVEKGCKYFFSDLEPTEFVTRGRDRREKRRALEEKTKADAAMPELTDVLKKTQ